MMTVAKAMAEAAGHLEAAGIDAARREARLLLGRLLGVDVAAIVGHPERPLAVDELADYRELVARRAGREPLSHLLGAREFWGLRFHVTPDTLDPRADSETVIEAAIERVVERAAPLRVLDFGTGTGCLLLALLSELPNATGLGVDRSPAALAVAHRNAAALAMADRARFVTGNWGASLAGPFDIIVANPPYIPSAEIDRLMPEVARHEPRMALDGGTDGLERYRELSIDVLRLLAPDGLVVLEIGAGQADAVTAVLIAAGFRPAGRRADLAGLPRCLVFRRESRFSRRLDGSRRAKKTVGKCRVPV
ncbi:MAG: peptide chain release factor N(5)-glutamine methyltransferase [Dongiaceae bacterium]